MSTELVTTGAQLPAVTFGQDRPLTPAMILEAVVAGKIKPEDVSTFKALLAVSAEQQFAEAFVRLQADLPTIVATSVIPNRGKYERFEDVMRQIQPMLTKHGFTVSFSQDFTNNRIVTTCYLTHGTHTRPNSFGVRASAKADSETQSDCKASTTAKRNALLQSLNIVIRQDCLNEEDDAALEGDPNKTVTPNEADELERRAKELNVEWPAFWQFAKAKTFATIPANRYAELDAMLRRKEKGR